jgi:hypothetical protein
LDQFLLVVLAVSHSSRNSLDGRKLFSANTNRSLWSNIADARHRLLSSAKGDHAKQGPNSVLANALGSDIKGKISPILYVMGIVLAFVGPWLSVAMYILVAVMWLIPDRRIERILHEL